MTTPPTHLTGAYAVNALDPTERAQFEAHLSTCQECRDEVTSLQEAASLLAAMGASSPSEILRARVLTSINQVRPLPPAQPARDLVVRRPATSRMQRLSLLAAAAVIAVIGATAGVSAIWHDDSGTLSAASSIVHASDAKHGSVESDAGWSADVWHSDSMAQAVIVTKDMPPPPQGTVYQVWLDQPSSGMVSAGLMSSTADQTFVLSGDAATANGAGITIEPIGGSERPTSDTIARFDFGQGTAGQTSH